MSGIEQKILDAQNILESFGLTRQQHNKLSALTLLALCNIKPEDQWNCAARKSMTLSKDIMEFVNDYYDARYKPNTRESFRKIALRPFVQNNIAILNPDDPTLSTNSSKTHYSISDIALKAIKEFNTPNWETAIIDFKRNQFPENIASTTLLRKFSISSFKSILNDTIELGRFNVFIGANGCGKSNILESLAFVGAVHANDGTFEGLYSRGIRIARPNLVLSSFLHSAQDNAISFRLEFENQKTSIYKSRITPENPNDIYTKWVNEENNIDKEFMDDVTEIALRLFKDNSDIDFPSFVKNVVNEIPKEKLEEQSRRSAEIGSLLNEYAIFDLNTKSLRGTLPVDSRKTPLGINGEGLDLLIANFNSYERSYLRKCETFFDWLENIITDKDDKNKLLGLKPGRSTSTLYFTDKYMQRQNNTFSAENSNEGILHVLFYIALFISNKTPTLFAIDNIETALNPRLCQILILELAKLAKDRGKQVLITTHNPAILDGLNLFDDDQRLFEVYRNDEGHTKTRRIIFRDDLKDKPLKLSEMWTEGLLGAIPKNFF